MLPRDALIRRFTTVIRVTLPVVTGFAIYLYLLGAMTQTARVYVGATGVFLFSIMLVFAYRALARGLASHAAYWVAAGALSGTLLLTGMLPQLYVGTVFVPLLVATLLLQYTGPDQSRSALIVCGATSALVVLMGQIDADHALDPRTVALLNTSLIIINSAVALLLLWQLTAHLHDAIKTAQNANRALVNLNNRLQRELHEHQRTTTALHASEQQGRALLHAVPDALFRLHRSGSVLDLKYFEHSDTATMQPPPLGSSLHALLPTQAIIERAIETRKIQHYEGQFHHNTRAFMYEGRVVAIDDDDVVAIVRDVTEARAVDRLKSEFISTVSHELRTPLTAVHGSIGLIIGGIVGAVNPQMYAMLDIAARNCERLLKLVNDILDIDQLETGKLPMQLNVVPLAPLLEQAVTANISYGATFGVTLEIVQPLPHVLVRVDSTRLIQAITNLVANAVKFSSAGSSVQVEAREHGPMVRISVVDQGAGISESFQKRIFQRFAQADASDTRIAQGSGLGLSITRAIVEQFNGRIDFRTELGQGSTFFIDLPVAQDPFRTQTTDSVEQPNA